LAWAAVFVLSVCLLSACAHIEVQPKDPQLKSMEEFARTVTLHLMDTNSKTYESYQSKLVNEVAPGVLNQLKARGLCAKSQAEAAEHALKMSADSLVRIEAADFPAKATQSGLVPVEVRGRVLVPVRVKGAKPSQFHIVYLVGTNKITHQLIIASVQFQ
jgi:hypothetical protein